MLQIIAAEFRQGIHIHLYIRSTAILKGNLEAYFLCKDPQASHRYVVGNVNSFVFVLPMDGDIVVDMIANSDDDSVALSDTDRRSWELIVHSHNTCRVAQPHYSCVFHLLTNYY